MTAPDADELIRDLEARGIRLWFEGDRLRFRAPRETLTSEHREALSATRTDVLARLRARASAQVTRHPLSYSQRSLWFLHLQAPQSAAYHVAISVRVTSTIDPSCLRHAAQALVDRHAILRTTYVLEDDGPVQRVRGEMPAAVDVHDAAGLDDAGLRELVTADYRRPFDLAQGPAGRVSLYSRSPTDHVLLIAVHHIAADGWTLLLLMEEFGKLYAEAATSVPAGIGQPSLQYADYVAWQDQLLGGPEGRRLAHYWRAQLAAPPAPLDLPTDRPRPPAQTFRGASYEFEIDSELAERLRQLARREGTTPFVLLLASYVALLHRLSDARDLIVGTPVFGRSKTEFMRVAGDFVNSVPIRARIAPGCTFRELLAQVRQTVLDALDVQEYPLPLLVQQLAPERDPSRSPLFDTFFVLQRFEQFGECEALLAGGNDDAHVDFGSLQLRPYVLAQQEGQFDLALQMVERAGRLVGEFKYSTDLFDADTVQRFARAFGQLVALVERTPDVAVDALPGGGDEVAIADARIAALIERLGANDIRLVLDGERLTVNAPRGALTPALRDEIGAQKEAVKEYLRRNGKRNGATLARTERRGRLPLSYSQQRLWFVKQMDPGNYAYNIPLLLRLRGQLDRVALQNSVDDLLIRHESLRTWFGTHDGAPFCSIEPQLTLGIDALDLSDMPEEQREAAAFEAARKVVCRPFDLSRAPLVHALVVRITADDHLACFVLDHIVSDGLSIGVFVTELQALYRQHATGERAVLTDAPVQFIDHVAWEQGEWTQRELGRHLGFWKKQLAGLPAMLQLPTDRPRPPVQTAHGGHSLFKLSPAHAAELEALARGSGATLFMVLLAAFETLLHRLSGETDFAVGTVTANRHSSEVERVVGFFANNIVLRADLSGTPTVRELIARVRENSLGAFAHQAMPFERLVEALGVRRELDHSPLFQVLFVLHGAHFAITFDLPGLRCEFLESPTRAARFDLAVDVFLTEEGPWVAFEYNADLWDSDTITRMQGYFRRLLEGFVAQPDAPIGTLPILDAAEIGRLVHDVNATASVYPREQTVHGLFEEQVARTPDAPALCFEDVELSYRTLNRRANQVAHQLRALGVQRESLVGVWMERSPDMVVALLGVLKAGGAYVPLDPAFPRDRIEYMMSDAALAVVLTQSHLAATLDGKLPRVVCMDGDAAALAAQADTDPAPQAEASNLAYVIYTSGSTGRPKGVMLEHRSVVNFLLSMHREPGIAAGDRFVSVTTLSFDIAGLEIHGPLTCGGTVVLASRAVALDGERLAALLDASAADLLQATPATWRLLLESGWTGRPGLKMLCGGEGLPRDLADKLLATRGELWNMYGPTETTIWSTVWRVTDTQRAVPIGKPIANTQVYVLEPTGLPAPIGAGGELCIGGDGLARGYRNRDDLTAEKFVVIDVPGVGPRRVYRTGDVVRFLADGRLEFIGRRDQQVKVRGFRIELGEIETVLATHPGLTASVVHVREDTPGDQRLVGYVVPAEGQEFDPEAARATLRAKLPEYMLPAQFVVLAALPLTPNAKVDRKALPAPQVSTPSIDDAAEEALMTPVQRRVADLWRDVLRLGRVGLHANFFDIGGHSLLLVKLQAALTREFGRDLPLVELFQRTTVAAQAERFAAPVAADSALHRARARAALQVQG